MLHLYYTRRLANSSKLECGVWTDNFAHCQHRWRIRRTMLAPRCRYGRTDAQAFKVAGLRFLTLDLASIVRAVFNQNDPRRQIKILCRRLLWWLRLTNIFLIFFLLLKTYKLLQIWIRTVLAGVWAEWSSWLLNMLSSPMLNMSSEVPFDSTEAVLSRLISWFGAC